FLVGTLAVAGVGLVGGAFVPRAHADNWDKKTIVTVNEPIIAGNKVLDPGTYVWKLLDSPSDRHIVQIFDKDQQHLQTTVLAIPNYRLQPTGKTEFSFWETPAGVPKAVRAWFYPGDNYGQEFPYPKKLVAQLASAAPVPVPMSYNEPAPAAQPEPQPEPAPAAAPAPAPQPEPQAQPQQQTPPPAPAAPAPQALPHTASFNSLFGLLGLASLSLAGLLTLADKRASAKVRS
ncbi:MAG: hypothetical protein JO061_02710, partial [Acidobacteriaceae bacterium]|nr:hypothetical protein [Acidobacteriaceae bacterium]